MRAQLIRSVNKKLATHVLTLKPLCVCSVGVIGLIDRCPIDIEEADGCFNSEKVQLPVVVAANSKVAKMLVRCRHPGCRSPFSDSSDEV